MSSQKSAGAIISRKEDGKIKYLILYRAPSGKFKKSWDFPRGIVEKEDKQSGRDSGKDGEKETALREIKEETGITDAKIIGGFSEKYDIMFQHEGQLVKKTIILYLAETKTPAVTLSKEHDDYKWCTYDEAMKLLTHKNSKQALEKAEKHIKGMLTQFF